MIDGIVNKVVSEVIKAVGPAVIQNVLGGNRKENDGKPRSNDEGSEVTVALPVDEFEDSDLNANENESDITDINNKDNFSKVNIPLPTFQTNEVTEASDATISSTWPIDSVQTEGFNSQGRVQLN